MVLTFIMQNLKDLTLSALEDFALSAGEQRFRARQLFKWMYQKRLPDFSGMTNMPKTLRAALSERATIAKLEPVRILESAAGDAVKFAFAVGAGYAVESVLLIDGDRRTACLSSQLGCALGCAFCETATLGFIRNLSPSEILGQLIGMNDYQAARGDRPVTNIVFMGMGEALGNYGNFMAALSVIMHADGFNVGARRITVSTAGVVPHIEKFMSEGLSIGLAISLNAWNDDMRGDLMPVNKKYPIASLVDVARRYFDRTGRRVTFEYVLIEGKTDTAEAAEALSGLLGGFPCKVNLIPVNPVAPPAGKDSADVARANGVRPYFAPADAAVQKFADELYGRGLAATVRKSRGRDIFGACGQLTAELLAAGGV
jgi:23S rRNA (adenine2503-C2)-methyltransferase